PLPGNPQLDPRSADMAATMAGWGRPENPYAGAADTASDWNHPVYYSSASDPVFTVHCTKSWGTCDPEGMQVHIPDAARAAGGAKEGQRRVLAPLDGQIASFGLPGRKGAILTALAHYGAFVGDTGASPWSVAIESGSTYTSFGVPDPWVDFVKAQPGVESWQ